MLKRAGYFSNKLKGFQEKRTSKTNRYFRDNSATPICTQTQQEEEEEEEEEEEAQSYDKHMCIMFYMKLLP